MNVRNLPVIRGLRARVLDYELEHGKLSPEHLAKLGLSEEQGAKLALNEEQLKELRSTGRKRAAIIAAALACIEAGIFVHTGGALGNAITVSSGIAGNVAAMLIAWPMVNKHLTAKMEKIHNIANQHQGDLATREDYHRLHAAVTDLAAKLNHPIYDTTEQSPDQETPAAQ
jgi:hypothetical protein